MIEPVAFAFPLSKRIMELIASTRKLPSPDDLREVVKELGMEELCIKGGVALYRSKDLIVLLIPRENIVIDIISASGELSDAVEVIAYHDRKLDAFIVETLPANDIEYEGNIGLEPVIIDAETGELLSNPVLGEVREEEDGVFLLVDEETYGRWRESGKLNTCPVCGGELRWKGKEALCLDCGYGIRVVKG